MESYLIQLLSNMLEQAMTAFGVDMDKPFEDLSEEDKNLILYGSDGKEFHFHYENEFGGVRDIDIPLRELLIISNVATTRQTAITRAPRCAST